MEIEAILNAAAVAGVREAGYTIAAAAARSEGYFQGMAEERMPDRAARSCR